MTTVDRIPETSLYLPSSSINVHLNAMAHTFAYIHLPKYRTEIIRTFQFVALL